MTMGFNASLRSQRLSAIHKRRTSGLQVVRAPGLPCGLLALGGCDAAQTDARPLQPLQPPPWRQPSDRRNLACG